MTQVLDQPEAELQPRAVVGKTPVVGKAPVVGKPTLVGKPTAVGKPAVGQAAVGGAAVGAAQTHLSQTDLEQYSKGQLPAARLKDCQKHLDSCDACRAELEDLRSYQGEMASFAAAQPSAQQYMMGRRKKRNTMVLPIAVGTGAVVLVAAAVAGILWWRHGTKHDATAVTAPAAHVAQGPVVAQVPAPATQPTPDSQAGQPAAAGRMPSGTPSPARTTTNAPAPTPTPTRVASAAPAPRASATTQPSRVAAASAPAPTYAPAQMAQTPAPATAASQPARVASAAPRAATNAAAPTRAPAPAAAQPSRLAAIVSPPSAAAPAQSNTFALLGPVGDNINDVRPQFTWQPLEGAVKYSIVIVDASLHPINHKAGLKTTSFQPKHPLHRGRTYFWQVTAIMKNNKWIVASGGTQAQFTVANDAPRDKKR